MAQLRDMACPAFGAYMLTDDGVGLATRTARHGGWDPAHIHRGGLSGAARLTFDRPLALRMVAELGNERVDQACASITTLARVGTQLVVVGKADDLASYRAFKAAGAADYFAFPAQEDDLVSALEPALRLTPAKAASALVVGVVGCSGGVGASTLTQNLAQTISRSRAGIRVALVDADLAFAPLAHDLNQDPTAGIRDALIDPKRIDRLFLDASMAQIPGAFWLYSYGLRDGTEAQSLQENLPDLLRHMAPHFDVILVDVPKDTLIHRPELAEALDQLVMVVSAGYAGLNGYVRLAKACQTGNPALRPIPVLSHLRADSRLSVHDISQAIGAKPAAILQPQDRGMIRAQQSGRPLVDVMRKSPYARQVAGLWQQITPDPARSQSAFWPTILRRQAR